MNKFYKAVASILAVLMLSTSANFAVLAANETETAVPVAETKAPAAVLSASPEEIATMTISGDNLGKSTGLLNGIDIDWENYVTESTGTKLTRDYTLGLTDDYLYDTLPLDTEERFNKVRESLPDEIPVFAPYTRAEIDASKVKFYVSPDGSDYNEGTIDKPFKTPERAVKAVGKLKSKKGGVTVYFREGVYTVLESIVLSQKFGGSSEDDLVFYSNYGDEKVTFTSAMAILGSQLEKPNDEKFNRKISEAAKPHIYSVDLKKLGYTNYGTAAQVGSQSLYINGSKGTLARWPNVGNTGMARYTGPGATYGVVSTGGRTVQAQGVGKFTGDQDVGGFEFQVANPRPFLWEDTGYIYFHGFFYMEWNVKTYRVQSMNKDKQTIRSYESSPYGAQYVPEKNFYYFNVMEELDSPGEWFLDHDTGILYVYPTVNIEDDTLLQFIMESKNIINLSGAKYTVIDGITFDMASTAINMTNGANRNIIQYCTVKNSSTTVNMNNTTYENGITCSILEGTVQPSGVTPELGNRIATNFVQNCYTKRIYILNGERNVISHNLVTGFDTMGIWPTSNGGDRIIEYNETVAGPDVGLDSGLIYCPGPSTNTGHVIRYNFFNRATIEPRHDPYGIYLDDRSSGMYVYGNVLNEAYIFLHSGSENVVYNNMTCKLPEHRAIGNSEHYGNHQGTWYTAVLANSSTDYTKGNASYYSISWQSRFPYQYDWHKRMIQHKYYYENNRATYVAQDDPEGTYLSSPRNNVYKNNVAVNMKSGVEVIPREINATNENNYVYNDPTVFEFTDWENGIYDVEAQKLAELCPGVEPFKKNAQMGPIFDPALLPSPIELPEIKPIAPMDTAEIKILPTNIALKWNESFGKSSYTVKLAKDPEFKDIVMETELQAESIQLPTLEFGQQYYWQVSTNSWTEKVSKKPSVMTATFVTYTYDEAINLLEVETYELENAMVAMAEFIESGYIVEEGTPEAENYPSDMPMYKAGTKQRLYEKIEDGKVKMKEIKIQEDFDAYVPQWKKEFYVVLAENAIPYVVNVGQGSHAFNEENFKKVAGGLNAEFGGDKLSITSASASGMIASTKRSLSGAATLAMRIYHEKMPDDQYTGVDLRGATQINGIITSVTGYCVILKPTVIELQKYPKPEAGPILIDVKHDNEIVAPGKWIDFESQVIPTLEGVRIIIRIDGKTIIDYLDKEAPVDHYMPGYYALMHHNLNVNTIYQSMEIAEGAGGVKTRDLEEAIKTAQELEASIVESDVAAEEITYKAGTKAKLTAAIEAANAVLSAAESTETVKAAATELDAVVKDIKRNYENEFVYKFKDFDLSQWESALQWESANATPSITLEENNSILAMVPDANVSTIFSFKKPLASKQKMRFGLTYEQIGNGGWQAIATRQAVKSILPTHSRGYFFVIMDDLIEFQKYTAKSKGEIVAKVENNGLIEPGKLYDVEVGSVNVDGGVLSTLKVDGKVVLEYLDTEDPIYDEGYITFYCHNKLGKVALSAIPEGN